MISGTDSSTPNRTAVYCSCPCFSVSQIWGPPTYLVHTGLSVDPSFVERMPVAVLLDANNSICHQPNTDYYQNPSSSWSHRNLLLAILLAGKKFIVLP